MRYLLLFLLLTACKATPDELAAARCDPTTDHEQCDNTHERREVCNPANGQWTPFALCQPPQACLLLPPDDTGARLTTCEAPFSGDDATANGDAAVFIDASHSDGQIADAKVDAVDAKVDGATPDADASDVPVTSPLPNQACFQKHCPSQTYVCIQSSICAAAINAAMDCVVACGGGQGCLSVCQANWTGDAAAFGLASCGMLICAGGCGDGLCEANETTTTCPGDCKAAKTGSCFGHCGGASTSPDCFCDQPCIGKGDCCNDYAAACGG